MVDGVGLVGVVGVDAAFCYGADDTGYLADLFESFDGAGYLRNFALAVRRVSRPVGQVAFRSYFLPRG